MKKSAILGYLLLLTVGFFYLRGNAVSLGEVKTKTETISKNENIVFLGDSIFDWYPTDKIFSDLPIVNSGIVGNKTTDVLKDMDRRVYQYNPTKVFINIGTNDIEWEDSEELNEEVFQNIVKIVEGIQKNRKNSEIYIISIYPVNNNFQGPNERHNSEIKSINKRLKKYCATAKGVEYVDAYKELVNQDDMLDEDYTTDGLHPNGLGYAKITEILMKYIYE